MPRRILIFLICLAALTTQLLLKPVQATPKVVDMRRFLDWPEWQLNITYHARDSYEDQNHTAELDMTATATYFLKRISRGEAWGQWQALDCQSNNLAYRAFWHAKHGPDMVDYSQKGGGPMVAPLADFQIGGSTPGYLLIVNGGFPAQMQSNSGTLDCPLVLGTTEKDQPGLSGVVTGPLPENGTQIQGSRVIPFEVPPFLKGSSRMTRMGIEYVLKPVPLSPVSK
ncbi:hypothetical protein JST97_28120 [bacterium]|nr:hypothetical protein [bacterium]